jgi:hypothetical protein
VAARRRVEGGWLPGASPTQRVKRRCSQEVGHCGGSARSAMDQTVIENVRSSIAWDAESEPEGSGRHFLAVSAGLAEYSTMERPTNTERSPASPMRVAVGIAVCCAALFAAFIAYVTNGLLSTGEVGSHETPLLIWQLIVALVGLLPAGWFVWALYRRSDRQALLWLVTGMVVYLAWGVLNDAAVHGWSNLKVF